MKHQAAVFIGFFIFLNTSYGQKTIISGSIKNLSVNNIKCNFIPGTVLEKLTAITIPVTDGKFTQSLSISTTTFLSFEEGKNYYGGFIEPGDSVVIVYDAADLKNTLSFSGKGKEKFILTDSMMQVRSMYNNEKEKIKSQPFPIDHLFNKIDSFQNNMIRRLTDRKSLMSTQSFNSLKAFLIANVLRTKYNAAISIFGEAYDHIIVKHSSKLTTASKKAMQDLLKFDNSLSYSYFYTTNVASIFSAYYDDNVKPRLGDDLSKKYDYLAMHLPPGLKRPVLFMFLEREIKQHKDAPIESIIERSFPLSKDSSYRSLAIQQLMEARALKNGVPAPAFSLENINGEKVDLSFFKGKVIYIDFWFASCEPCHKLFNEIKPVKEYFRNDSNVVFLTVSVDNVEVWKKALAKFNIEGYHAFTENKFREHPIIRSYNVNEYPTTYLIDKKGEIYTIEPSQNPDELKKEIEAAMHN